MLAPSLALTLVAALTAVSGAPFTRLHERAVDAPAVSDFKAFHIGQETSCTKQIVFKRPYKDDRWNYKIFGAPSADSTDLNNMTEVKWDISDALPVVSLQSGMNRGQYVDDEGTSTWAPVQTTEGCKCEGFVVAAYSTTGALVYQSNVLVPTGRVPGSATFTGRPTRGANNMITVSWNNMNNVKGYYVLAGLKSSTTTVASKYVPAGSGPMTTTIKAPVSGQVAVGVVAVSPSMAFTSITAVAEIAA